MQSLPSLQWNSHDERQLFGSSSDLSAATAESYKQRQLAIKFIGIHFYVKLRKLLFRKFPYFNALTACRDNGDQVPAARYETDRIRMLESTPHFKATCHSMQFLVLLQGVPL
jgi:hypothetical protein